MLFSTNLHQQSLCHIKQNVVRWMLANVLREFWCFGLVRRIHNFCWHWFIFLHIAILMSFQILNSFSKMAPKYKVWRHCSWGTECNQKLESPYTIRNIMWNIMLSVSWQLEILSPVWRLDFIQGSPQFMMSLLKPVRLFGNVSKMKLCQSLQDRLGKELKKASEFGATSQDVLVPWMANILG